MHNNPRDLLIGERIFFKHITVVDYVEKDDVFYREVLRADKDRQGYAQIIGCVKRAVGTYTPANRHGEFGEDYAPARLEVTKYVWLYECRKGIAEKAFLVHPDDIVMPDDPTHNEELIGRLTRSMVQALNAFELRYIRDTIST
jgi:hypothetical protein